MLNASGWYALVAAASVLVWCAGANAEDAKPAAPPLPSCDSQEYRQFDFWIGSWTVTEGGQPAGRNTIEPDLQRCALFESWTSVDGSRGRSVNFFDRKKHRWHQTWIDDHGGALELDGRLVRGSMILEGKRPGATAGSSTRQRITWTPQPDGSVRQHWETMKAGQSNWETVFDGLYKRSG